MRPMRAGARSHARMGRTASAPPCAPPPSLPYPPTRPGHAISPHRPPPSPRPSAHQPCRTPGGGHGSAGPR
eukprot:7384653-Prymnesium_polylepis.1